MAMPDVHSGQQQNLPEISAEFSLLGDTGPPLIFFNGFRMPMSSWDKLINLLPENQLILLYNRTGVGQTPKATTAQTAAQVGDDLRQLLRQLALQPPYVVVAHSLGGIFANYFARKYPQEISGLILIEASHPEEIVAQRQFPPPALFNWINNAVKTLEKIGNPFKYSEDEVIDQSLLQIAGAGNFPTVPLCIISGTQKLPLVPSASFGLHCQYQLALVQLSPVTEYHPLEQSGHFPQLSEPEKVATIIKTWLQTLKG